MTQPLVLVVMLAGVLFDQPIRQLLVVSSEFYRQIGIPEPAFGFVSAGSATLGLLVASPLRRLAMQASPRRNALIMATITVIALFGTAAFIPWWGVGFFVTLSFTMRMLVFLQSHYLNQLVTSEQRATVLSFRGLAVNVSYGLMSLGFAVAVSAVEAAGEGTGRPDADSMAAFRYVIGLLPWYFVGCCSLFALWTRLVVGKESPFLQPGGFEPAQSPVQRHS